MIYGLSAIVVVALIVVLFCLILSFLAPSCKCGGKVAPWNLGGGWVCHCDGCNKIGPIGIDKKEAVEKWRQ